MSERLWYVSAIETMCRITQARCPRAVQAEVEAIVGFPLGGPYPASLEDAVFAKALALAAPVAFPDGDPFWKWGRDGAETYFQTTVGKVLRPLIRVLGPDRYLSGARRFAKHANTFQVCTSQKLGERHWRIAVNDAASGLATLGGIYASLEQFQLDGLEQKAVDEAAGVAREVKWR